MLVLKKQVYQKLLSIVEEKIVDATKAIDAVIESRDNETKSSAGDKFETGRAMMQIEQQRNQIQLSKALQLQKELQEINIEKVMNTVERGSLVITNQGKYFISIGIGKVKIDSELVYAISLLSPVGKLLFGKTAGESIDFQNRKIVIEGIF